MNHARGPSCPSALQVEAFAVGDVGADVVAGHVGTCEACTAYVAHLRLEGARFMKERPPELMLQKQRARREAQRTSSWPRLRWVAVAAMAGLGALVVLRPTPSTNDDVRLKGASPFAVVVKRAGALEVEPVFTDAHLKAGDAVRFAYAAERAGFLAVLDVDGAGHASVLHPFGGKRSAPVEATQGLVPGSVVLDDAPGPEWFVAVFTSAPIDLEPLVGQLANLPRTARAVELRCGDCRVDALRIQKDR